MSAAVEGVRPDPDALLRRIEREDAPARGRLRVYLGMAPGVGKTVAMLLEGRRRRAAGEDVVVALVEAHGRAATLDAVGDLEVIPRRSVAHRGVTVEEMDLDAVLARRPELALVDELAHTNAPGSRHAHRWEDVEDLLVAGVSVISTVNVQHLESLADVVESITGVPVRERIPDRVVDDADEIHVVDLSPRALRERLEQGLVYPEDRAAQALHAFFREGNLTALRELVLRKASTEVERDLQAYMLDHAIAESWPASDRVLAVVEERTVDGRVVRRASRLARALQAELIVLLLTDARGLEGDGLDQLRRLSIDLGGRVVECERRVWEARVRTLIEHEHVEHVVAVRAVRSPLHELLSPSLATRLTRLVGEASLHLVAPDGSG